MKLILLKLCVFISFSNLSQNNYDILNTKGLINLNKGDTLEALENFLIAVEYHESSPFDFSKAIICSSHLKRDSLTYKLLYEGTRKGLSFERINDMNLSGFKKSELWLTFISKKDSIYSSYQNSLDKEWIDAINNMKYMDQKVRSSYLNLSTDSVKNSELTKLLMSTIDSLNFETLLALTKKKGFPTTETVGYYGINNIWLLLWHHRGIEYYKNPMWIEIKPYIIDAMKNGKLRLDFLSTFEDYYAVELKQPMCYGTMFSYYRYFPEYNSIQVLDVNQIDERRKQIGLCPIELHLESLELPLPLGLKNRIK